MAHSPFIVFVLLVCFTYPFHVAHGQQNTYESGMVTYQIFPAASTLADGEIKSNSRVPLILEQFSFDLAFSGSQSVFKLNDNNRITQQDLMDVSVFFVGVSKGRHYWQDSLAAYRTMEVFPLLIDSEYLLIDSFENGWHSGWEITNEAKQIDGYTCVKAIRDNLGWDSRGNERRFPIVAWFCPELPFPFGPMKYGGLPGLILELQTHLVLYAAKSITLGNDVDMPPLPDLERMTEKSYYEKLDERIKEMGRRRQNR